MSEGRRAVARWTWGAIVLVLAACAPSPLDAPASGREDAMHIEFERSGGVAGIRLATTVDTDTLSADEAAGVRTLVDDADFFNLPGRLTTSSPGADRFAYRITVRSPGRSHTVDVGEGAAPASLRPLLDWLMSAARKPH